MPKVRFSLMTLILLVAAIGGMLGVWYHRYPWSVAFKIDDVENVIGFSNDSSMMVVTKRENQTRLIRAGNGETIRELTGHENVPYHATFSADDRMLATGGDDNDMSIRLWDMPSGNPLHVFKGHTAALYFMEFTPDQKSLISSSCDGTVRVWDLAAGKQKSCSALGTALVFTQSNITKDSQHFIFPGDDGTNSNLDLQTGKLQLHEKPDSKPGVHLPADQNVIIGDDRWLLSKDATDGFLWDVSANRVRGVVAGLARFDNPFISVSREGSFVTAVDSPSKSTVIWDVDAGSRQQLDGQATIYISPDERRLYTSGAESSLTVWTRSHPVGRYGFFGLPEMWLFMLAAAALLWRGVRRMATLRLTPRSKPVNS